MIKPRTYLLLTFTEKEERIETKKGWLDIKKQ